MALQHTTTDFAGYLIDLWLVSFKLLNDTEFIVRAKSAPLYLEARVPNRLWDNFRYITFRKEV